MVDVLAALHAACMDEAWDRVFLAKVLGMPGCFARLVLADPGDRPVAFAIARVAAGEAEILTIGVVPAARGAGHGDALVHAVCAEAERRGADSLFLEVAEDNAHARALYDRNGFVPVGRRPGYYTRRHGPAVAALVLRRALFHGDQPG
jgi:ribosomal-protein-alanine N-acetyltransferase